MTRQRANKAAAAFGRVGLVTVPESPAPEPASSAASVSAGENDSSPVSLIADPPASEPAGRQAAIKAGRGAGRKASKQTRRVGRPRGPQRVALTVRILAANDARLTAAVAATGDSPQYIVDAALKAYLDALGIA